MSDRISVLSKTQVIHVEPASRSVSVVNAGPQGPPGTGGGGGDSLWELVGGNLRPVSDPTEFNIYTSGQTEISADSILLDTPGTGDIQILPGGDAFIQGYDGGVVIKAGHGGASVSPGDIVLLAASDIGLTAVANLGLNGGGNTTLYGSSVVVQANSTDLSLIADDNINVQATTGQFILNGNQGVTIDAGAGGVDINIGQSITSGTIWLGFGGSGDTHIARETGAIVLSVDGGDIRMYGLPTSSAGLLPGSLYVSGGFIKQA